MKRPIITLVTIVVVFVAATTRGDGQGKDGKQMSIQTKADCDAVNGTCNKPEECDLAKNVHIEPVAEGTCSGDVLDFCCISKLYICEQRSNGTFITEAECQAKPGFAVSGMSMDGLHCCKPKGGKGSGHREGVGPKQSAKSGGSGGVHVTKLLMAIAMLTAIVRLL